MSVLFSLGIAQALFLSLLIGLRRPRTNSRIFLIGWLFTLIGYLFFYLVSFSGQIVVFDFLLILWCVELLQGPLLYLYTRSVLDHDFKIGFINGAHAIPWVVTCGSLYYYHYIIGNSIQVSNGYLIFGDGLPLPIELSTWGIKVITLGYLMASFYVLQKSRKQSMQFFSAYEKTNLVWLRNFLIGVTAGYLFLYTSIPGFFGIKQLNDFEIGIVNTIVYVFFFFYAALVHHLHQLQLVNDSRSMLLPEPELQASRYKKTGLTHDRALILKSKLLEYMSSERPYLKNDLTLRDLAGHLEVSVNHLSQLINENVGANFFQFVNQYRIDEFKKRIARGDHHQYSLVGVALTCGFSSKSSFYSVFKKVTGSTPAEYVEAMESSIDLRSAS